MEESNKKHSTKSYSYGSNKSNMYMLYWDMEGRGVEESGSEKRKAEKGRGGVRRKMAQIKKEKEKSLQSRCKVGVLVRNTEVEGVGESGRGGGERKTRSGREKVKREEGVSK